MVLSTNQARVYRSSQSIWLFQQFQQEYMVFPKDLVRVNGSSKRSSQRELFLQQMQPEYMILSTDLVRVHSSSNRSSQSIWFFQKIQSEYIALPTDLHKSTQFYKDICTKAHISSNISAPKYIVLPTDLHQITWFIQRIYTQHVTLPIDLYSKQKPKW